MARYHPYKGMKGWVLLNVLLKLPNVPVLYSGLVVFFLAVGGAGLVIYILVTKN
jgi:hypothetical protein